MFDLLLMAVAVALRLLPIGLFIDIIVRSHRSFNSLEKAGIALFFASVTPLWICAPFRTVGISLYIAGSPHSSRFTTRAIACLAMTLVYWPIAPLLLWYGRRWRRAIFKVWLRSFQADWEVAKDPSPWARTIVLLTQAHRFFYQVNGRIEKFWQKRVLTYIGECMAAHNYWRSLGPAWAWEHHERVAQYQNCVAVETEKIREHMPYDWAIVERVKAESCVQNGSQ